jgi:hypothetical protein
MTTDLKPWQLTSAELAREIEVLEVEVAHVTEHTAADRKLRGRLNELYAEADERKRLAASRLETAASHYPDNAS